MKKKLIALAAAALVTLPLAACSSSPADSAPDSSAGEVSEKPGKSENLVFNFMEPVFVEAGQVVTVEFPEGIEEVVPYLKDTITNRITLQNVEIDSTDFCAVQVVHEARKGADVNFLYTKSLMYSAKDYDDLTTFSSQLSGNDKNVFEWGAFTTDNPDRGTYIDPEGLRYIQIDYCEEEMTSFDSLKFVAPIPPEKIDVEIGGEEQGRAFGASFDMNRYGEIYLKLGRDDGRPGLAGYTLDRNNEWFKKKD